MKTNFVLAVIFLTVLSLTCAQISYPSCSPNQSCSPPTSCIDGKCRCQPGMKIDYEKNECVDVIGSKCENDNDCLEHASATCNRESKTCVCNAEDGCTNGATTMTILSTSIMAFLTFGVFRVW